ncbi:hypothetical protein GPECTOR_8g25 [Gonium pectorale]|uniref:RAP domain-containing protein n=1 Tax=Gonium pectorale TaxID=33097 RepID=A0A150GT53_GONPE|nr:hypothetical protein GPECTOR_8g25 [Gonium pectorale]|eukprot:KXZ52868.1 hypothetical protein GPECTOR_8g25 [Gonium pectorale]
MRTQTWPPNDDQERRQLVGEIMSALAAAYLPLVPGLWRLQDCTGPLWACAKAGHWGDGLAAELLARMAAGDGGLLQRASGREISNLWWSLSSGAPAELLAAPAADTALRISGQRLQQLEAVKLNAHDCSNVLVAAARLQRGPEALWDHMTACLAAAAPDAVSQALANCLHSLGSLAEDCGHTPRQQDLQRLEAEEIANAAWALAKMPRSGPEPYPQWYQGWYEAAVQAAMQPGFVGAAEVQAWSSLLYALGLVRHRPPAALLTLAAESAKLRTEANAQVCANCLWSLANLYGRLELLDGGSRAAVEALVGVLAGRLRELLLREAGGERPTVQGLCNSLWALVVMGTDALAPNGGLTRSLLDEVAQRWETEGRDGFKVEELTQLWQVQLELSPDAVYSPGLQPESSGSGLLGCASLQQAMRNAAESQQQSTAGSEFQQHVLKALAALQQARGEQPLGQRPAIASVQAEQWLPQLGRSVDAVVELEGGRQLAVEVDGPTHFLANGEHGRTKNGSTQLRDRQLERVFGRGNVLSVPYWEWHQKLGNTVEREEYLSRLLLRGPVGRGCGAMQPLTVAAAGNEASSEEATPRAGSEAPAAAPPLDRHEGYAAGEPQMRRRRKRAPGAPRTPPGYESLAPALAASTSTSAFAAGTDIAGEGQGQTLPHPAGERVLAPRRGRPRKALLPTAGRRGPPGGSDSSGSRNKLSAGGEGN